MSDCEGDFKCPYCKGLPADGWLDKPEYLHGACKEAELQDKLTETLSKLGKVQEALREAMEWDWCDDDMPDGIVKKCKEALSDE